MKIIIECTPLQLKTISEALHMFDYGTVKDLDIPKEGWALYTICQDWIERESQLRKRGKE